MGVGRQVEISIHALREEGDLTYFFAEMFPARFLSTPSARRATKRYAYDDTTGKFLSTPSARRATEHSIAYRVTKEISIHALREEGDHRNRL